MFWPDDQALLGQHQLWPADVTVRGLDWWPRPAWDGGPSFGQLITALRPALRAALLLGWQVDAVEVGVAGPDPDIALWQSVELETLQLDPAKPDVRAKLFSGANVRLGAFPVADLHGRIAGTYATGLEIPVFGTTGPVAASDPEAGESDPDAVVPAAIVEQVEAFVAAAVAVLAPLAPATGPFPRQAGGGLLWVFDPAHWRELDEAAVATLAPVVAELRGPTEDFLRGQLFGERTRHVGPHVEPAPGPANLYFLQQRGPGAPDHRGFWRGVEASLQARGEATRFPEHVRLRLKSELRAPTWLDVLAELVWRGVLLVDGLVEPADPPEGIEALAGGTAPEPTVILRIWDGAAEVVLRRVRAFAGQDTGLDRSVTWDYVPGDAKTRPTVLVVAGRGVGIEHDVRAVDRRPWDLEVYRVQDDAEVPARGTPVDTASLLAPRPVEPYDAECATEDGQVSPDRAPQLLVKPKRDGVLLIYPVAEGSTPTGLDGPVAGDVVPRVVELTVPVNSGTAAYALDVHYFTGRFLDLATAGAPFDGGAHLSVWATEEVTVDSNLGPAEPERGDPSAVAGPVDGHLFVAELWQTDRPEALPRPWAAELPVTPWAQLFPPAAWLEFLQTAWELFVLQQVQDLFPGDRTDPFPLPVPALDYDGRQATFRDPATGTDVTLTPALHRRGQHGYLDNLLLDLADVVVGLVPFLGDAADIGEAVYAWQTGRDRWGRPVSDLQLALLLAGAAVPLVSGAFLSRVAAQLPPPPATVGYADLERLAGAAVPVADVPADQVRAALATSAVLRAANGVPSDGDRALAAALVRSLGDSDAAVRELADRLVDGRSAGWLTAGDVITDAGDGFTVGPLHVAYLRHLRAAPGTAVSPAEFLDLAAELP